jgi:type IV secretory pathway TrbF-like protein
MRRVRNTFVTPVRSASAFGACVVRTYVLDPYQMVRDPVTGVEKRDALSVLWRP